MYSSKSVSRLPSQMREGAIKELISKRVMTLRHLRDSLPSPIDVTSNHLVSLNIPKQKRTQVPYLGTIVFGLNLIRDTFQTEKNAKRTRMIYILGLSLSEVLGVKNPSDFMRAIGICIAEFEIFTTDATAKTKRKLFFRKPKNTEEQTGTFLYRSDNLEFSYLDPRPLPFRYDFVQVFDTFCQIAVATYLRISETIKSIPITTSVLDIMEKLDTQFKIIINGVSKDFDLLFNLEVAENFRLLDTTKSRMLEAFVSKSE